MPALDPQSRPDRSAATRRSDHLQIIRPPAPRPPLPAPPLPLTGTECPVCRGAGFLRPAVPVGHPEFGTLVTCECRRPQAAEQEARRRARSNLAAWSAATFAQWNTTVAGGDSALRQAAAYAQAPDGWLVICGGVGAGKTHLAAAIGHAALAHGQDVLFTPVPDLLDRLSVALDPGQEPPDLGLWARVREAPLLILDDLGPALVAPWVTDRFVQLLDARYARRLPTVVTTYGAWDLLDPRLVSRLHDPRVVGHLVLTAGDYRRRALAAL